MFCTKKALTSLNKIGLLNDIFNDINYLMMSFLHFWTLNVFAWLTLEEQKALGFHQQIS